MTKRLTGCLSRVESELFVPPADSFLISIRDPGTEIPDFQEGWSEIILFEFWDLSRGDFTSAALAGYDRPPTRGDAIKIYEFIVGRQTRNIFAHCEAGISRSGAIREFLDRMGWTIIGGQQRHIHPNDTVLSDLNKLQRELGLIRH